ncbi:MAG TPA: MXAN_5187 C-terminal domain-containing protein [Myxococcota bacterium]|nr:MXAN_5187 C-terminal domain-containing protein [Myxococcota bacterium]
MAIEEEIGLIEGKLNTLRLDYDQYFLGNRPREPVMLRNEVQKMFTVYSQMPIQNTALRFKFNSLTSRFFALKRQWDETLRKIEEGTYKRHLFKADLHERQRMERDPRRAARQLATTGVAADAEAPSAAAAVEPDLFESYRDALRSTGQDVSSLTREKLAKALAKQEAALRAQHGCEAVKFRVVVEAGKARLKATPFNPPKTGAKRA